MAYRPFHTSRPITLLYHDIASCLVFLFLPRQQLCFLCSNPNNPFHINYIRTVLYSEVPRGLSTHEEQNQGFEMSLKCPLIGSQAATPLILPAVLSSLLFSIGLPKVLQTHSCHKPLTSDLCHFTLGHTMPRKPTHIHHLPALLHLNEDFLFLKPEPRPSTQYSVMLLNVP